MREHGMTAGKKLLISSVAVVAVAVLVICTINFLPWGQKDNDKETRSSLSSVVSTAGTPFNDIMLGDGLIITAIDKNSDAPAGEIATDTNKEIVTIVVENTSGKTLQYASINAVINGEKAEFELSTLPTGEKALVFEKNGIGTEDSMDYSDFHIKTVIYFEHEPEMMDDIFELTTSDGIINIRNISAEDIKSDIYVYYKNYSDGLYTGGITYRSKVEGGLKAGEIRQLTANNFSLEGSRLMFVDYVQ